MVPALCKLRKGRGTPVLLVPAKPKAWATRQVTPRFRRHPERSEESRGQWGLPLCSFVSSVVKAFARSPIYSVIPSEVEGPRVCT